jgi:hypothetical protein
MAFGWGTAAAAAGEALRQGCTRGNGPHMVTAGYVLLTVLAAGTGWGLWQLLAEFNREIDE